MIDMMKRYERFEGDENVLIFDISLKNHPFMALSITVPCSIEENESRWRYSRSFFTLSDATKSEIIREIKEELFH